jgi:hypothetical protein
MDPRILEDLTQLAMDLAPRSMLVICDADSPLPETLRARLPEVPLTTLETKGLPGSLEDLTRHELVLVPDALERLPHAQATHLIAGLRDLYSETLYVLLPPGDAGGWTEQDLIALGLDRVRRYAHPQGASSLFRFNLKDYKKTPDWLNPRYWANPEMWEKARW